MGTPREQENVGRRPRLSVVTSEPRTHQSGMGSDLERRPPGHPLEFDEWGLPIAQPPLSAAECLGRLLTG
jgi:hypothetical protein